MKLVLSRKGFDSSAGGVPSPIFSDGRMVSLPIPDKKSVVTYADVLYEGCSLAPLVAQLTGGRIPPHYLAHIDPDIVHDSLPRQPGWRPIFGQSGQAQGHLNKNGVGIDDLFLFFGLFRRVECTEGTYSWAVGAKPCHVLWGWFQVAQTVPLGSGVSSGPPWAEHHPHFQRGRDRNNIVYLSREHLKVDGLASANLPGAGVFPRFSDDLQLTAQGADKTSTWVLPLWFYPDDRRTPLTYHSDPERWRKVGSHTLLTTVARGQEFILDCDEYPEAIDWVCSLIQGHEIKC